MTERDELAKYKAAHERAMQINPRAYLGDRHEAKWGSIGYNECRNDFRAALNLEDSK